MEKAEADAENVEIKLPVEVEYVVLNELLQQKLQGKILSKGKNNGDSTDQAKIEEIYLEQGLKEGFPISLQLKIKLLTTIFSGKEVEMIVHLSPEFQPENQEILVKKYEIDGLNNGWVINNLLESLVNSFLYNNLKNKMKFNLQPLLQSKIADINSKLSSGMEVKNGIFLSGEIKNLRVEKILFEENAVVAVLNASGNNKIKIENFKFFK